MTDRDRLIELVDKAKEEYSNDITDHTETDYIVECLLNNCVIVPPCKVGDTVYFLDAICVDDGYCINNLSCLDCKWAELQVREIDFGLSMYYEIGKTVFLTKEEAENELRKRSEDNA